MIRTKAKKYLLIFAGSISLLLGLIGIFLPLLPTTPFLLLSSFCYMRSSKTLYNWLINHKIFGEYIYNYITYGAVSKNTKIGTLMFLWVTLSLSIFIMRNIFIGVLLIIVGISVTIHILMLKIFIPEISKKNKNL